MFIIMRKSDNCNSFLPQFNYGVQGGLISIAPDNSTTDQKRVNE